MNDKKRRDYYQLQFDKNEALIKEAGIPYTQSVYNGASIVFQIREGGKPTIDYYPATGRWKVYKQNKPKMYQAKSAKAFISWYNNLGE